MKMATIDESGLVGKIRDKPIGSELRGVLGRAADAVGIDTIRVTSGSQPGTTGRRTGSTRHDNGRAADLQLVKDGSTLSFTDQDGGPIVEAFVTAAAANGATGIGAGVEYMGNKTIHVGFGTSPQDHSRIVWGAGGKSANAPVWLRVAAQRGWDNPVAGAAPGTPAARSPGRFVVVARGGLQLRKGPGLEFGTIKTLETGTEVTIIGFDGPSGEWGRADLQGDGFVDGHLFTAFLRPADAHVLNEDVQEPNDGEA
jgi:hypothetical protein